MAIGDLYRSRVRFAARGQSWSNYVHYERTDSASGFESAQQVAEAIDLAFTVNLGLVLDDNVSVSDYAVWVVKGLGHIPGRVAVPWSPGILIGAELPSTLVCRITLAQEVRSARCNGVFHMSGLNSRDQRDGTIPINSRTGIGPLFVLAQTLVAPLVTSGGAEFRPVIMSRSQPPLATAFGDPLPITGFAIHPQAFGFSRRQGSTEGFRPAIEVPSP